MADKHLKEQQPFSGLSVKLKRLCALCDEKFRTITYEGFEEWKKEEEIRTKSFFVKRGGAKKVTNKQFTYYMCHRSVENVSNETTLTIDEDSNHLRREKEAILREKEKCVVCQERAELVYERIRRRTQFINTAASVASTEEMKCLDQCLEDLKHMGYSEFGSSL
ncbi:hypothetical protein TNCV_1462461 [Trichonephila clavipes]|nr:hypothetical protein TNCV_1462461 [Trichonephila clavipes]